MMKLKKHNKNKVKDFKVHHLILIQDVMYEEFVEITNKQTRLKI